jgi:hypothetical protein
MAAFSLSSPGEDRAIQYSRESNGIRISHGVLDSPPSRGMTAECGKESSPYRPARLNKYGFGYIPRLCPSENEMFSP